jgi:hypothetical protein
MLSTRQGIGILLASLTTLAAVPTPAARQAFLGAPTMYLTFEVTVQGTKEFNAPKDSLTDGAHRTNQSHRWVLPLEMAMPDTCPPSTQAISMEEAMEQGRCIGWAAETPMDDAALEALSRGKPVDITKSRMFVPVEYSIDDVARSRFRDRPEQGFGTSTRTSKGRGTVYAGRSGMLLCDTKRMTCDLGGFILNFNDGPDRVTVNTTSDVPGMESSTESTGPSHLLLTLSEDQMKKLVGFSFTLPEPSSVTVTETKADSGDTVTFKMTLSSKPPAKSPSAGR